MKKYICIALLIPSALCAQGTDGGREKVPDQSVNASNPISPGWRKIRGTTLKGGPENTTSCPPDGYAGHNYPFADGCQNVFNAWSSAVADTTRNRLIIWGGGHADYAGNEVYSLELSANPPQLIRLDPPSPPNTSNSPCPSPEALSDGRPNSRHTYDSLAYLPDQDELISVGGGVGYCGYGSNGAWTLSMSSVLPSCSPSCNSVWTLRPPGPAGYGFISAYDSAHHLYWLNDQNNLWSFDPARNIWSKHGPGASNNFDAAGVYDPGDQYFINVGLNAGGGQSIVYYKVGGGSTYSQINPGVDSSCAGAVASAYPGVAWDPIDKRVVVYPNAGNVLYLLDPKSWKCKTESYGSTKGVDYPQDASSSGRGTLKRFNYFPNLDIYVLCNDPYSDCWYLHRRRAEAIPEKPVGGR